MKTSPSSQETSSATSSSTPFSDEVAKRIQNTTFCSRTAKLSDDEMNRTRDKHLAADAGKRVENYIAADDSKTLAAADQSIEQDFDVASETKSTNFLSPGAKPTEKTNLQDERNQNSEGKTEAEMQRSCNSPSQVECSDTHAVTVSNEKQNPSIDVQNIKSEITRTVEGEVKVAAVEMPKKRTRKKWKKPPGKPNRPLSAYNLYFRKERAIMLGDVAEKTEQEQGKKRVHRKTHGKIGFAEMAKIIGAKWKVLPQEEREEFVKIAIVEKEKYAKDLAQWREEQKKKTMISSMESGRKSKISKGTGSEREFDENNDIVQSIAEDREKLLRQHQAFRMQMMQEMQVGHLSRLPGEGHGRQMPTIDYLRNMQDDRSGPFLGRSRDGTTSSLFSHYPNAAEGSGRDLYQQMVAMTSGAEGQGRESDHLRQLKMARMHMMHGSMADHPGASSLGGRTGTMGGGMEITSNQMEPTMGSPMGTPMEENGICNRMGNNGMGSTMGMVPINNGASQIPNPRHYPYYEMERYRHMPYHNQMPRLHNHQMSDPHRAADIPAQEGSEISMSRFQQRNLYN